MQSLIDFLTVAIDEEYVRTLAARFERMVDGHSELLSEIPVLNSKLDTLCEQLKSLAEVARSIPILLERESRLAKVEEEHGATIREHAIKLVQFSVIHSELRGLKWGMALIGTLLSGIFLAVLKHIFG